MAKMANQALQAMRQDDDLMRDFNAGYHALVTDFLRTPMGYRHLLGLEQPPSTLVLPDAETLLDQPVSAQPRLVCEAMRSVLQPDEPPE